MLKRSLIAVVAVAVLATVAQAGYIKTHDWPTTYVPQELTTIPVWVDVGYYVEVLNQNTNKIKLYQKTGTPRNFEGSCVIKVKTNFNLTLTAGITSKGVVTGSFGVSLDPSDLNAGTATDVKVTATATNLNIETVPANTELEVATVKISVVPR